MKCIDCNERLATSGTRCWTCMDAAVRAVEITRRSLVEDCPAGSDGRAQRNVARWVSRKSPQAGATRGG